MSTIRLTKTKALQKILDEMRQTRFPLLDDTEIIKALASQGYLSTQYSPIPSLFLTEREEKRVERAEADIKRGRVKVIQPSEEIDPNMF